MNLKYFFIKKAKKILGADVAVYGRFKDDGTAADFTDRNAIYQTTLSGDITGGSSYHVVTSARGALIDGFVIRDEYADGSLAAQAAGKISGFLLSQE